ncbi:hypothetical protein KEM48_002956 [Puccinia striiformis f. sp. tritici PST-130]|nr:hypothetical protein KEM48_002956 [Puccinia striiformis f. sp. tritici PST-130]
MHHQFRALHARACWRSPAKNATSNRGQQLTPRSTHSDLRGSYHEVSTGSVGKSKPAMLSKAFGRTISRTVVTCLVVIVSILVPNFERVMSFLGAFAAFVICTILPVSAEMILTRDKEGARRRSYRYHLLVFTECRGLMRSTYVV